VSSSKGEDVQAYTRLLKFQKKRYGVSINDIIVLLFSLTFMLIVTLFLVDEASGGGRTFIFFVGALYSLMLIISFFDYTFNLGLFHENGLYYSSAVILVAVVISVIMSLGSSTFFPDSNSEDLLALLSLINLIVNSGIITYFITTLTPTREGKEEIIQKLAEIRKEIAAIPIADLKSESSVDRAIKWIQYQQRSDGIWGENNPLYETSEVLRMFINVKKNMDYSWKTVVNGTEEVHTIEQTYYLILEALDTASIEPNNEMLIPVLGIAEIDPQHIDINNEVYDDFKESLIRFSEWEFIKEIERFDDGLRIEEIPIIFAMSKILQLKGDHEVAQKCADIFANTFGILINRAATRFNITNEKEISTIILGKMYNAIISLVRKDQKLSYQMQTIDEIPAQTDEAPADDIDLSSLDFDFSADTSSDVISDEFSLPDFSDMSPDLTSDEPQVKIGTSLAAIRNYIRSKQSIDGSWSGNIEFTAECLLAVSDQESSESEYIKSAVHYLLALQEKNGSWQDNVALTAKITKVLDRINQKINLGGF
jgi:hypothetical protein